MHALATPAALVVDSDAARRASVVKVLDSGGFRISEADSFAVARRALIDHPPAVLITALKLAEYNGLHLVLRARAAPLRIDTLVIADPGSAGFRTEVQQAGAAFVLEPVTEKELLAAVIRTLFRHDHTRAIEPPFERRLEDRRTAHLPPQAERRFYDRRRSVGTLLQTLHTG
jgi:DNA-binding response OmpR family regulator